MKVLFATGIYPPDVGGPATYVSHLARELHARGHGVEVVAYGDSRDEGSPFTVHRVPRSPSVPRRYLRFFSALLRRASWADVIFAQDPISSGLPAFWAAKLARRRFVLKIVGDLAWEIATDLGRTRDSIERFQEGRHDLLVEALRRTERWVARAAGHVIVPCNYLRGLVAPWGVQPQGLTTIYNSLPEGPIPVESRKEARSRLGIGGDPVLLAAGRFVPWKRFDLLIRLMPEVLRQSPGACLVLVGSGPLDGELRRTARDLGVERPVTFVGPLDTGAMALHLAASDLFLLPSTYEGLSHLLLEAMRAGVPVVATDAGGNAEVVTDGQGGRIVPAGETDSFKEAALELCSSSDLRDRLGQGARERARCFSWEKLIESTLEVLGEASRPK